MKQVISVRDLEEMVRSGKDIRSLPENAILTPSARDFVRDFELSGKSKSIAASANGNGSAMNNGKLQPPAKPLNSKSSKAELEEFFNSAYCHALKEQLC